MSANCKGLLDICNLIPLNCVVINREEMYSEKSHYLILKSPETGEVAAFVHFQFVWDDEDEPEFPVLYCFELHVSIAYQVVVQVSVFLLIIASVCILNKTEDDRTRN